MRRSFLLLILVTLLLVPTLAQAQKSIQLEPTKAGVVMNASGQAMLEIIPKYQPIQVFTLAVRADVANREALSLSIETKQGVFQLGELRMLLGTGTTERWSTIELSPVFPLEGMISITVRYGQTDILIGYF